MPTGSVSCLSPTAVSGVAVVVGAVGVTLGAVVGGWVGLAVVGPAVDTAIGDTVGATSATARTVGVVVSPAVSATSATTVTVSCPTMPATSHPPKVMAAHTARATSAAPPTSQAQIGVLRRRPAGATEPRGATPPANNRSNAPASPTRWPMLKLIAATTARDVSSLTAGLSARGGSNTSAPLLRSGASGGVWPVSRV